MTGAAAFPIRLVTKEIRPLLLPFAACIVVVVAAALFPRRTRDQLEWAILAYVLGAAALGAQSIGHEYSHGTLGQLLSQPIRRQRLLLVKLGVLAPMLVTMGAVAWTVAIREGRAPELPLDPLAVGLLAVLSGLFIAPWLTMLCRSAIAGTIFSLSLPYLPLMVSWLVYFGAYGQDLPADLEMVVLWRGSLALCAVGAVMTWRMFKRLEAIDGPGPDVHVPQWLQWETKSTAAPVLTKRHPIWLLVKKELRLQQMAFALPVLGMISWSVFVSPRLRATEVDDVFSVLSFIGAALVSLLVGSLASAEERQLGTLEWQVLLPVAAWKQWAVKAGTALSLALLLGLAVPALLTSIPALHLPRFHQPLRLAAVVTGLTVCSLYVSSLSTSGLQASLASLPLVVSLPLIVGAVLLLQFDVMTRLPLLLSAGFLLIVLRFALTNHRSADRAAARVWTQAIWMAVYLTAGIALVAGMAALS